MDDLLLILEQVARAKEPLLIVARSVGGELLATLIKNTQLGVVRACVVSTGDRNDAQRIERLVAKRTSTRVFHDEAGLLLGAATLLQLGRAVRVNAGLATTTITLASPAGK